MLKFEFGKFTEVTKLAKSIAPEMFDIYEKIYICPDTRNWWIIGIQKDMNDKCETEEGIWLCERAKVFYSSEKVKSAYLNINYVKKALEDFLEDFDVYMWDSFETSSLEEAIKRIDGGYGINPEEE